MRPSTSQRFARRSAQPSVSGDSDAPDPRDPLGRLSRLLDGNSVNPLHPPDGRGVLAVRGWIDGLSVIAFSTDATSMGGALGAAGCHDIVEATEAASRSNALARGFKTRETAWLLLNLREQE